MFGLFKKQNKDPFNALCESYNLAEYLFIDFVRDEVKENGRETNTVKIRTSASALVAAIYYTKRVPIQNGKILSAQKSQDILQSIIPFFDHISSSLWDYLDGQGKFDMTETTFDVFSDKLFQIQQQLLSKYSTSIVEMIDSGDRNSFGRDLAANVTRDLFGEVVNDMVFRMGIVELMSFKN